MKQLFITIFLFISLSIWAEEGFTSQAIPDSIWKKMQGKSFLPNPYIQRSDLRYLRVLHWDYDEHTHQGELICNKRIADKLLQIFRSLYEQHYPIQRMRLPEEYDANDERQMSDNNTSCFCYRTISGRRKLSYHARGLAIDVNPLYNPFVRSKNGILLVQPENGKPYVDRKKYFRYQIRVGDPCHTLFLSHGFTWGGSWRTSKDYQHFEFR